MSKSQCRGKTATGAVCRAPAGPSGLCFFHANPEKAHTLGQIGGRKNRSQLPEPIVVGALTAAGLLDILAKGIQDVLSKKMPPRNAGALAQLCSAAHRVLPTVNLEMRVARLEQRAAEQQSRMPVDTDPTTARIQDETSGGTEANADNVPTKESGDGEEGKSERPDEEEKA